MVRKEWTHLALDFAGPIRIRRSEPATEQRVDKIWEALRARRICFLPIALVLPRV